MAGPRDEQRLAGRILSRALAAAAAEVRAGSSAQRVDVVVRRTIGESGGELIFRESGGADEVLIRVNEARVGAEQRLQNGDLVSIDAGCRFEGWCADAARTWRVSESGPSGCRLVDGASRMLQRVADVLATGGGWLAADEIVAAAGRESGAVFRADLSGHGIGRELHEDPILAGEVPPEAFRDGRAMAVELVVWGRSDGSRGPGRASEAVRFEETIWVSETGAEVLTCG